jgi:ATP-dependent DNA helicase RecG
VLLSGLTLADIKQGNSKLRNRVIGRVLKELRYIEQWGSGIRNAIGECKKMGLPQLNVVHGYTMRAMRQELIK